jgi:myo-inositol-1(or 4)-monophosphatase
MPQAAIPDLAARASVARSPARRAGAPALGQFRNQMAFAPATKGTQDRVSAADVAVAVAVEDLIRGALARAFPRDAMLGEAWGGSGAARGGLRVVGPIDGTIGFVDGVRYGPVASRESPPRSPRVSAPARGRGRRCTTRWL